MYKFPKNYVRNEGLNFKPIYLPGETYTLYLNPNMILDDPAHGHFYFRIINVSGSTIAEIRRTDVITLDGNTYHLFLNDFVFPLIPDGYYHFQIYNNITGGEVCRSQIITVSSSDKCISTTCYVKYRHNDQLYGVRFDLLPDEFYLRYRMPITQISSPDIRSDRTQYREASNGRELRNVKSFRDIVNKLEFYFAGDEDFEAISAMLEHIDIFIADNKISCDISQVKVEKPSEFSNLSKATFEVIVDRKEINYRDLDNYGEFILWGGNNYNIIGDFIEP